MKLHYLIGMLTIVTCIVVYFAISGEPGDKHVSSDIHKNPLLKEHSLSHSNSKDQFELDNSPSTENVANKNIEPDLTQNRAPTSHDEEPDNATDSKAREERINQLLEYELQKPGEQRSPDLVRLHLEFSMNTFFKWANPDKILHKSVFLRKRHDEWSVKAEEKIQELTHSIKADLNFEYMPANIKCSDIACILVIKTEHAESTSTALQPICSYFVRSNLELFQRLYVFKRKNYAGVYFIRFDPICVGGCYYHPESDDELNHDYTIKML